jgi:hypothetical protein
MKIGTIGIVAKVLLVIGILSVIGGGIAHLWFLQAKAAALHVTIAAGETVVLGTSPKTMQAEATRNMLLVAALVTLVSGLAMFYISKRIQLRAT